MTDLVAIDIGGTYARFAIASIAADRSITLGEPVTLATNGFPDLKAAWSEFERRHRGPLPQAAAIAIAAPVIHERVQMTNNSWKIDTGRLAEQLGIERVTILNDFAAVAHAAANVTDDNYLNLAGDFLDPAGNFLDLAAPGRPLPGSGTISVIGPGTGLGVAHFHRSEGGYRVQATEGGHIAFAPVDALDDAILARMRERYARVSVERVVSGPGIVEIHAALAGLDHSTVPPLDDRTIWQRGLDGQDALAAAAVERFCLLLGQVSGDFALAHGASGVVIAGGLGLRIRETLAGSGFAKGFCDKGRYEAMMTGIPVKLLTHPQPGLYGAAAAFALEHGT